MFKNNKSRLKSEVRGKMSEQDAGKVGKMQAVALLILAVGVAVSLIIFALKY